MVKKRNNINNIIRFFANLIIKYKIMYLVLKTFDKILTLISLCNNYNYNFYKFLTNFEMEFNYYHFSLA